MIIVDSDIFVLDLRYQKDPRYLDNQAFLSLRDVSRATTIYNVLEVCGIMSFNLSSASLLTLYADFGQKYGVSVFLPPDGENFQRMIAGTVNNITQKMTFGDAQILWLAEQIPEAGCLITWNTKDFMDRTHLRVLTPKAWLIEKQENVK